MGISKRELFEDYYMDEIGEIMHEYNDLHKTDAPEDEEEVDAEEFFGI